MSSPVARLLTVSLFAVALVGVGLAPACNRVTEQTEAQRKKLEEQKLIQKYSDNVAKVDTLQKAFTDSWKTANEQTNIKDLKEAFDSKVLPALRSYVKALQDMPTESDALKKIHAILVGAYDKTLGVFEGFSKDLTEDNIIERHKALLAATDKVHEAERKYYADLKGYYSNFNVTLVEQKASGGAAKKGDSAAKSGNGDTK